MPGSGPTEVESLHLRELRDSLDALDKHDPVARVVRALGELTLLSFEHPGQSRAQCLLLHSDVDRRIVALEKTQKPRETWTAILARTGPPSVAAGISVIVLGLKLVEVLGS
jgi:hypothetical protein